MCRSELEGDRSQGKVKGKIREVIDMRALISDLGFSELIRTCGANPDKCWGDSQIHRHTDGLYIKWGEFIGIPWHSSEDDVRRLREVGLLEWIYYVKPGTPPRD